MSSTLPAGFTVDASPDLPQGFTVDAEPIDNEPDGQFAIGVQDSFNKMTDEFKGIFGRVASGEQEPGMESALQAGAAGVDAGVDVVGAGINAITPDKLSAELIDLYSGMVKDATSGPVAAPLKAVALKLSDAAAARWSKFSEDNPRAARNAVAAAKVGAVAFPVKTTPDKLTVAGRYSNRITASADRQVVKNLDDVADDLVRQKRAKKVNEARALKTTEGGGIVNPKIEGLLPEEKVWKEAVKKVPGISGSKTVQGNLNSVQTEANRLAKKLKKDVLRNNKKVTDQEVDDALFGAQEIVRADPLFVGDAVTAIGKFEVQARKIIESHPRSAAGILQARKDIDALWKKQKGEGGFEGNINAQKMAVLEIRRALNELVARKVPGVDVRKSLKQQSDLIGLTRHALAPKAAVEGRNALIRTWQRGLEVLTYRGTFNQYGAILIGAGGLGAAAVIAPYFTATLAGAGLGYAGLRALTSVPAKRFLASALKETDRILANTTDGDIIKSTRADRAAILALMKMEPIEDDFEDEE